MCGGKGGRGGLIGRARGVAPCSKSLALPEAVYVRSDAEAMILKHRAQAELAEQYNGVRMRPLRNREAS